MTKKYLRLLALLAEIHGDDFERILAIRGRQRRYFGRSREEVAGTGKSMHPRRIEGTDLWAMTNADTAQKKDIVGQVLRLLGYPNDVIMQARRALR